MIIRYNVRYDMLYVSCYLLSILVILCLNCTCYVWLTKDLCEPDRYFHIFLSSLQHHVGANIAPCTILAPFVYYLIYHLLRI